MVEQEKKKPLRLTTKEKRFVVEALACYDTPREVIAAFKAEFGRALSRQAVEAYDPTRPAGRGLGKALQDHFWQVREQWDEMAAGQLLGQLTHRLGLYQAVINRALVRGDDRLALDVAKQAAQDKGGAFTNRRELTGKDGKPLELSVNDMRRELAAKMLKKLVADGKTEQEARDYMIALGVDERHIPKPEAN